MRTRPHGFGLPPASHAPAPPIAVLAPEISPDEDENELGEAASPNGSGRGFESRVLHRGVRCEPVPSRIGRLEGDKPVSDPRYIYLPGVRSRDLDGWLGQHGWQIMYIAEAVPTLLIGVVTLFLLTDRPEQAKFLTAAEKTWLAAKLASEKDFALGYGGDGCAIAKQAPAG